MKKLLLAGVLGIAGISGTGWAQSPQTGNPEAVKNGLEQIIPHIELTRGIEAIGGATIPDVVVTLREQTDFPICIEELEYDRKTDGLTLDAAIAKLRALKAEQKLTHLDEARLNQYQELAKTEDPHTFIVGINQKTFTLVEDNATVRAVLDRTIGLDPAYIWKNYGTSKAPLVVLQPRTRSALDWPVPSVCGGSQETKTAELFGTDGKLTTLFAAHAIYLVEMNGARMPNVPLDLCHDHLTARDVLNRIVTAGGNHLSWTLSGIKGLRWLSFQ